MPQSGNEIAFRRWLGREAKDVNVQGLNMYSLAQWFMLCAAPQSPKPRGWPCLLHEDVRFPNLLEPTRSLAAPAITPNQKRKRNAAAESSGIVFGSSRLILPIAGFWE